MKKAIRFVLLLDQEGNAVRRSATELAGQDGYVLVAHTPGAALEFVRQYHPSHVVMDQGYVHFEAKFLPDLLLEYSPETEIVLISNEGEPASLGRGA
ncbi:MAG TPA: hypothetical protein VG498_21555 [Terriglobales bacterium]|nr:hypothetical protein [Terriglobales bacterium]